MKLLAISFIVLKKNAIIVYFVTPYMYIYTLYKRLIVIMSLDSQHIDKSSRNDHYQPIYKHINLSI